MRFKIFLFLAFFATSAVSAQLYDNRNRYLQSPHSYNRFAQELDGPPKKPAKRYTPRTTSSRNSYNYYRNRVNSYSSPYLKISEYYAGFHRPDVRRRYAGLKRELAGSEKSLEDCHCNIPSDLNVLEFWYKDALREIGRVALLRFYEGLFEKKLEKVLNKSFPNFKAAQKAFYKEYVNIHDNFHYNKISPFVKKDYINKENLLEKNTAFYNVAKHNGAKSYNARINLYLKKSEVTKSSNAFLISKELQNRLYTKKLPYHGYFADKHINYYNKQDNYEYKLGMFNACLVYYQNRGKPLFFQPTKYTPYIYNDKNYDENEVLNYMKNIVKKDVSLNDYQPKFSLAYSKAIVSFYNMTFPQRSITKYISAGRWGRIPVKVPVSGTPLKCQKNKSLQNNPELNGIKQAILNKPPLKKAVFRFLANANSTKESQNAVLEAVGCWLKNEPFTWSSKLGRYRQFTFQKYENPNVVLSINLSSYLSNKDSAKAYYQGIGIDIFLKTKHKGIADVLKYIYDNPKYWSVEGATIRHFLESKAGIKIPSSLSNRDLGKLFDFGGGNSNTLTIAFSDYARKYITNFHHGDGKYGMSLFTDPFKLQALHEILNGNTVDFKNKIYDRILNVLENKLNEDPFLLLEIPCAEIQQWRKVAQHEVPSSIKDKINEINSKSPQNDWDIQNIQDAGGTVVNMDFFPVTISQFPINPSTKQQYTPQEFFDYFRLNLTSLASNSSSNVEFEPSTITGFNEDILWNSNNPLGAVISIRINEDSGSVVCSRYNIKNHNNGADWFFTTLSVPWTSNKDGDGNHPVSGHRQFGYYKESNNRYVFYVRGVDRFRSGLNAAVADLFLDSEFTGADDLWNTFQTNINNYVNTNGGNSEINNDIIWRPDWDTVKDVLSGAKPISDLGCK